MPPVAHRLLIAHRDQSVPDRSRLVSGLRSCPGGPFPAPSRAMRPVAQAGTWTSLPLRGQRRLLTGFPIISPAFSPESTLNT